MRWLLALGCVVSVADAHPVRNPFTERAPMRRRPELSDPLGDRDDGACERGKTWSKVTACLRKTGKVTLLYELDDVKLVAVNTDPTRDYASVYLYAERDKIWRRGNLTTATSPTAEVLAFKKLDERPGYRLDVGMVTQTSTSLDTVTTTRVVLSRKLTTVCGVDVLDCRTVMTACDAFIGGKAYWSFRGAVAWVGRSVKVRGDVTNAGKLCAPVKSMLAELD